MRERWSEITLIPELCEPLWGRRRGETKISFVHFQHYRDMPPEIRSVAAEVLKKRLKGPVTQR